MELIWCTRHGKEKGFKNTLVACVACQCRIRDRCKPHQALPLAEIVAAKQEAQRLGHDVEINMPLFEWALDKSATAAK